MADLSDNAAAGEAMNRSWKQGDNCSLHASWQQMDLLLEPYAKSFADMVRRSRGVGSQERN
jgi:hypothetical protein